MKKYKGNKTLDEVCSAMKEKGMEIERKDFDERGGDHVIFKGAWHDKPYSILYNTVNGKFYVYHGFTTALIADFNSTEFDEEEWYLDLMNTFYES